MSADAPGGRSTRLEIVDIRMHSLYSPMRTHAGSGDGKEIPMHQTRFSRLRVLSGSLLMGLLSALTLAATVLADGAGGSFPK